MWLLKEIEDRRAGLLKEDRDGMGKECVTFSILIKKGGVIISDDNNR